MTAFDVDSATADLVFHVLAAVLHLGNIVFAEVCVLVCTINETRALLPTHV